MAGAIISCVLTEEDIPGASLYGRKPAELSNDDLKFWLKCRGDSGKRLKTKAELVKRVEEYIVSGKDKTISDPYPNGLYTKRKLKQVGASCSFVSNDKKDNAAQ
ncbi:Hypothetical predicted protein [Paramuricea clavata]|uniref:Uncharacterized protein n=1 Tax=Paramuricea clavata TaxID=317549 RepID=A0A6S7I4A9_PARCT|nr:Hypothetical predicted protein [Paramuricea clavata]